MRRLVQISIAAVALLAISGVAWAYLSSAGTGQGSGAATIERTVILGSGAGGQTLLPTGSPSGSLQVTLRNPGASSVHVNGLALDTNASGGGYSATASACKVTYVATSAASHGWTIAPGETTTVTLTGSVQMGADAPSTCQGQSFDIYLATT